MLDIRAVVRILAILFIFAAENKTKNFVQLQNDGIFVLEYSSSNYSKIDYKDLTGYQLNRKNQQAALSHFVFFINYNHNIKKKEKKIQKLY